MSQENSVTMNHAVTHSGNLDREKVVAQKTGISPLKLVLLTGLGLFGLITLVIVSWPLIAWIGSLRVG